MLKKVLSGSIQTKVYSSFLIAYLNDWKVNRKLDIFTFLCFKKFFCLISISPFLGSGSDHMAFLQRAGIPCIDQKFGREKVIH